MDGTNITEDEIEKYIIDNYEKKEGSYLLLVNEKDNKELKLPFVPTNLYDLSYILSQYINIMMDNPSKGYEGYLIDDLVINSHSYFLDSFDGENYSFVCSDDTEQPSYQGKYDFEFELKRM